MGNTPMVTEERVKLSSWLCYSPDQEVLGHDVVQSGGFDASLSTSQLHSVLGKLQGCWSSQMITEDGSGRGYKPIPHFPNGKLRPEEKTVLSKAVQSWAVKPAWSSN